MKKIAIIGGGWYGCHIARVLQFAGYDVTIFESADDIFRGVSGKFGIRLHLGPHYPRSEKTRKSCQEGFAEFIQTYPDLVVRHLYSLYGLGVLDADNQPSKVDRRTFSKVLQEVRSREIDHTRWGYRNLQTAFDVEEPSIIVGNLLRETFRTYLQQAGIKIVCNARVNELIKQGTKTAIMGGSGCLGVFDYVVNTTSYQALLPPPKSLPFDINVIYQPCLALVYEDKLSNHMSLPPFSFIVMDGWFPCMMPYIEDAESTNQKYIITHGKYTIMGSFKTVDEANTCLAKIDEEFIRTQVQPKCEAEMEKHWPLFGVLMPDSLVRRFNYIGWKAAVVAKVKSNREFRSALTFERDGVVHIIPGKVSNIFDAARETHALIEKQNVLRHGDYLIVKNGTLQEAANEITEKIDPEIRNTGDIQTYSELSTVKESARIFAINRSNVSFFSPKNTPPDAVSEISRPPIRSKL